MRAVPELAMQVARRAAVMRVTLGRNIGQTYVPTHDPHILLEAAKRHTFTTNL